MPNQAKIRGQDEALSDPAKPPELSHTHTLLLLLPFLSAQRRH